VVKFDIFDKNLLFLTKNEFFI
jgi:hypothetical protein